jgi:hypothetical protein
MNHIIKKRVYSIFFFMWKILKIFYNLYVNRIVVVRIILYYVKVINNIIKTYIIEIVHYVHVLSKDFLVLFMIVTSLTSRVVKQRKSSVFMFCLRSSLYFL